MSTKAAKKLQMKRTKSNKRKNEIGKIKGTPSREEEGLDRDVLRHLLLRLRLP